ncbi:MAG: HNH endonuclease signature motif containing protein [SAR324 cluster bacterium]|nr:HNH endonuclease signature motif containing protein [SAR324 cluster bacterium]
MEARFLLPNSDDEIAKTLEVSIEEIDSYREQIKQANYDVPDSSSTLKTRGSAQQGFSGEVKTNYRFQCAITGIKSKEFLVASHIVPRSADQSIRLDPSNGICLSLLVDKHRCLGKGSLGFRT